MTWQIIQSDIIDWANSYDGELFHFIFSDWPYNLKSIQKRFGKNGAAPAKFGKDGAFQRQSVGFMGCTWDTGIAYDPATWQALMPLLHPGGFTASFSHPRTQHRLAMAQEQAGYIINPAIYSYGAGRLLDVPSTLGWIYGSGKPNGTRVDLTNIANAQTWYGWQYGSPLGPEIEPVIIAQKPYQDRTLDSIIKTGAGAMNIAFGKRGKVGGRFPGNLVITHHPECKLLGVKQVKNSSDGSTGDEPSEPTKYTYGGGYKRVSFDRYGDEDGHELVPDYECHHDCLIPRMEAQAGGNKAHYFYQADWSFEVAERLAMTNPAFYSSKVGPNERNIGCWNLPLQTRHRVNAGGLENEPRFAPTQQYNPHPTLKPIKLCAWIAGLCLPPPEYAPRRCLVPCCGTGSEIAGALLAGWDEVIGIEVDTNYAEIGRSRLREIEKWMDWGHTNIDDIIAFAYHEQERLNEPQMSLFEETR